MPCSSSWSNNVRIRSGGVFPKIALFIVAQLFSSLQATLPNEAKTNVTVLCRWSGESTCVDWYKDGIAIYLSGDLSQSSVVTANLEGFTVESSLSSQTSNLTILSSDVADSGTYTCVVSCNSRNATFQAIPMDLISPAILSLYGPPISPENFSAVVDVDDATPVTVIFTWNGLSGENNTGIPSNGNLSSLSYEATLSLDGSSTTINTASEMLVVSNLTSCRVYSAVLTASNKVCLGSPTMLNFTTAEKGVLIPTVTSSTMENCVLPSIEISLQCMWTSPSYYVGWYKDGNLIYSEDLAQSNVLQAAADGLTVASSYGGRSSNLTLLSSTSDDSGNYTCVVGCDARVNFTLIPSGLTDTTNLCIYTPPQITPINGISSVNVNGGDNVNIQFTVVRADPPVSRDNITWTVTTSSGKQTLNCTNTTKYTFSFNCLSVVISNAEQTDVGSYTIVAVTRAGTGSSTVSVSIRGVPPTITTLLSDTSAVAGSSQTFVCTAAAFPIPAYGWRFNGDVIRQSPTKYSISSDSVQSVLTVFDLALSDEGTYICSASNRIGVASRSTNLTIFFPPVLTSSPRSNRDVVLGEELVVSCSAEGRPDPGIVWQMNSTVLTSGGDVLISNTSNGRSELRIRNFTRADRGRYSCTATNTFGSNSRSFEVNLIVRPFITGVQATNATMLISLAHNGQLNRTEFDNLSLSCTASGEPPPEIVWLLDGTVLSTDSRRSVMSTLSYSNLTISELQLSDAGTYTCRATSGNVSPIPGQTTVDIQLTVTARNECLPNPCQNGGQCTDGIDNFFCNCISTALVDYSGRVCNESQDLSVPPSITTQPVGRTDYKLFETVTLTCTAEGNPDPVITWYMDGVALQGPQSVGKVYTIDRISPGDRGAYHCEATNFRGRATSNSARVLIEGILQFRINITRTGQIVFDETSFNPLQTLAVGQQLRGTGNVTAEIVSLVQVPDSTEFIVTMNTNSTQSPQQLTQIVMQPLTEQLIEFSDILQNVSFTVRSSERHDGCPMEVSRDCTNVAAATVVWPETEIDQVATVRCPCGPEGENPLPPQSVATRRCGGNYTDGAEWGPQMCTECQFSDSRLQLCALLEEPSQARVANILVNVTEDTSNFAATEITVTSTLLTQISNSSDTADEQVQADFFTVMDNILEVNETELMSSNVESGSLNRAIEAFDRVVDQIPLPENTTNGTMASVVLEFRNFVIQVVQPPRDNASFTPDTASLVMAANSMRGVNSTDMQVVTGNVTLPPGLTSSAESIAFAVFVQNSLFPTDSSNTSVGSIILSVSIPNQVVENLTQPVMFTFEKNEMVRMTPNQELSCVFWDTTINGIRGGWSTGGCVLVNETEDVVVCECDHLTSFSMLLDVLPIPPSISPPPVPLQEFLASVTYIGCGLSVIALIITLVTYFGDKNLRGHLHRQLLISLCFALLGLYITFIITNAVSSYPDILPSIRPICGLLSALLHYFFLVTFLAMAAIAINLYRKLVVVINSDIPNYLPIAVLISWVVPIFIVGFSIAPHYQYYTGEVIPGETVAYCRAQSWPFYFGLILPFGVIYIMNMTISILILISLIRRPKLQSGGDDAKNHKRLKESFWIMVGLSILFGVSWIFGMLATAGLPNYIRIPFDILFTILASLQGLFVFLFYCLKSPECCRLWMDWLHCRFTQASRTTTSSSGHNRGKSSQGASTLRRTRSTRINSILRPSLVATLNRRIFNQFNRKHEDVEYTSSAPTESHPTAEISYYSNDFFEELTFQDNFSGKSFYFGLQDNEDPDNECTVFRNEEPPSETDEGN